MAASIHSKGELNYTKTSAHIKTLLEQSIKDLQHICRQRLAENKEELPIKCCVMCEQLLRQPVPQASDTEAVSVWIKSYTQENQLVDLDFSEEQTKAELQNILDSLGRPEGLINSCFKNTIKPVTLLGVEILECLYWRRGALLYMYCATLEKDINKKKSDKQHIVQKKSASSKLNGTLHRIAKIMDILTEKEHPFHCHNLECAHDGITYLQTFLHIRSPLQLDRDDVSTNDEDTYSLLKKGLFSDIHMLALMYGGELCWWYLELATEKDFPEFKAYIHAVDFLQTYIQASEEQLKGKGWNCDKAKEILKRLQNR